MSTVQGNIYGNQNSYSPTPAGAAFPYAQGTADFSGPFGVGQGLVRGQGTVEIGPLGVSTSVPWADGFSATAANTVNGLGLASPFATTSSYLNNLGMNSFGQENPYSPLIGTPYDLNFNKVMASGAFGGYQSPLSPYTGMAGLPLSDGSMGFGGPGGSEAGTFLNSPNFGGYGPGGLGGGISGNLGGGIPGGLSGVPGGFPGSPAGYLGGGGGFGGDPTGGLGGGGGFGGGFDPNAMGGFPPGLPTPGAGGVYDPSQAGGGYPGGGGAAGGGSNPFPDQFGNPTLFSPVPDNVIPGIAQTFSQQGGDFANRFNLISDGISKMFLQGQADPNMPRQEWGSGSTLRSPYGIFETGVGWAGGNANAGLLGAQASGMSWAMVRNPINPGMVTSYANPYYNNYNFNEGFTNA